MAMGVSAAAPVAGFSGSPAAGTAPLDVAFTDESTGSPAGWAWFFGDETFTEPWNTMNVSSGWTARYFHNTVTMPDGSIILMGGADDDGFKNDTWRSTNNGTTWTLMNASSGWLARWAQSSVSLPDGSIVLTGGQYNDTVDNETWQSADNGATWTQINASSGWSPRCRHSTVSLPDGSILLIGGYGDSGAVNDTWRSTDNGVTWSEVNTSSGWSARYHHSTVAMSDGSVVLAGGFSYNDGGNRNDTWRSADNGASWTQVNESSGWTTRNGHTSAVLPDDSIILMGGLDGAIGKNDTWRSTDGGATWIRLPDAGWPARVLAASVVCPDGSIVLTGGDSSHILMNDTWRFQPAGSSEQNPSHTFTVPGNYPVTLEAYNAEGYTSTRKADYITVTGSELPAASGTVIGQGATIFIGEDGLNVTHALNQAYYLGEVGTPGTYVQNNSPPVRTSVGW